jgi:hypothetical protein
MGIADVDELEKELQGNLVKGAERIAKQREDLVTNMTKYSSDSSDIIGNANTLAKLEENLGEGFRGTLEGVFDSLSRTGDDALIAEGYSKFLDVAL